MRKTLAGCLLVLMSIGGPVFAQDGAKDEAKKAGSATKEAGRQTGEAAKHAGKATARGAKKGAKSVKKAVTGDAHATCVDGTVQAGKTEEAAASGCVDHGGVRVK